MAYKKMQEPSSSCIGVTDIASYKGCKIVATDGYGLFNVTRAVTTNKYAIVIIEDRICDASQVLDSASLTKCMDAEMFIKSLAFTDKLLLASSYGEVYEVTRCITNQDYIDILVCGQQVGKLIDEHVKRGQENQSNKKYEGNNNWFNYDKEDGEQ